MECCFTWVRRISLICDLSLTRRTTAIFRRLAPYAEKYNLRFVSVSWRDYPNSTPYSAAELDNIFNGDEEAKRAFVQRQGLELAKFLEYLAQTHDIPKVGEVEGKKVGGIALLSWSMGNIWSVSLLGNAQGLPSDTKRALEDYLRTVVFYGERFPPTRSTSNV